MAGEVTVSIIEQPTIVSVNETSVSVVINEQIVTLDLGVTGPQGPRGNSLLNGVGEPTLSIGINGDFYIDIIANELYGPKTTGSWGIGIKLSQDQGYVHEQTASATTWTINHNLDFVPNITVVDTFGTVVEGSYDYPNDTTVVLNFSSPFSGKAFLS
jgi:hypothetical protein